MKKLTMKSMMTALTAAALAAALMVGCAAAPAASSASSAPAGRAVGTVLLSVNPEIEVEYDGEGLVLEIEGINDDGKSVVSGYTGYQGKKCEDVVSELVQKIYEAGYFQKTVDGHVKNIVVKLEEGSAYPDNEFLEEVAEGVRKAVNSCGITSSAMTVDEDDLDDNGYIGLEKAKDLVLSQLGLKEASFTDREYELDDGVYELEFTANGIEYEFEVNAVNGKVLKADYETNDDWDDFDDDRDDRDDRDDDDYRNTLPQAAADFLKGYAGKNLSDNDVKKIVNYAVEHKLDLDDMEDYLEATGKRDYDLNDVYERLNGGRDWDDDYPHLDDDRDDHDDDRDDRDDHDDDDDRDDHDDRDDRDDDDD